MSDWGLYPLRGGTLVVLHGDRTMARLTQPDAAAGIFTEQVTDADKMAVARARIDFSMFTSRLLGCLRLCDDFTDEELQQFDGPTFKSAIGAAFLAAKGDPL